MATDSNENAVDASSVPPVITPQKSVLGMVTGSKTGTYYRFGEDIKSATASENFLVDVKESSGSIDNINRITSSENAALGIVQSDVLGFLMRSQEPQSKKIAKDLRMIFPFYQEEVHFVARKHIRTLNDLNGKVVVVGPNGSGSWLTAMNLFNLSGVRPTKLLRNPPEEGLIEVLRGRADAMIYVVGKPVKLFQNLNNIMKNSDSTIEQLHFVPIDDKVLLAEYSPAKITSADYDFVKEDVPTIAVTAVLVTYNFARNDTSYAQIRCNEIRKFSKSIYSKIDYLKKNGHQKWKEVDLSADVGIWRRDECSITNASSNTIEKELLNTLDIKW